MLYALCLKPGCNIGELFEDGPVQKVPKHYFGLDRGLNELFRCLRDQVKGGHLQSELAARMVHPLDGLCPPMFRDIEGAAWANRTLNGRASETDIVGLGGEDFLSLYPPSDVGAQVDGITKSVGFDVYSTGEWSLIAACLAAGVFEVTDEVNVDTLLFKSARAADLFPKTYKGLADSGKVEPIAFDELGRVRTVTVEVVLVGH